MEDKPQVLGKMENTKGIDPCPVCKELFVSVDAVFCPKCDKEVLSIYPMFVGFNESDIECEIGCKDKPFHEVLLTIGSWMREGHICFKKYLTATQWQGCNGIEVKDYDRYRYCCVKFENCMEWLTVSTMKKLFNKKVRNVYSNSAFLIIGFNAHTVLLKDITPNRLTSFGIKNFYESFTYEGE